MSLFNFWDCQFGTLVLKRMKQPKNISQGKWRACKPCTFAREIKYGEIKFYPQIKHMEPRSGYCLHMEDLDQMP